MPQITVDLVADLPKNGPTDPIDFYRRPLVGYLFRERINRGLRLLGERRYGQVLEVGFGAGAVLLALAPSAADLFGLDLDADPRAVGAILAGRNVHADLCNGTVYDLPYRDASFDLVVSFSVFEHLVDYSRALGQVRRVLRPGGHFLLGMPAVNKVMELGFRAIGFKGIEDHHVTTPAQVARSFASGGFSVEASDHLGLRRVRGAALYYAWLLAKPRS